jgi:catechol 2,3-dioxygenase-like lactoylglutathione lyase family enzyme
MRLDHIALNVVSLDEEIEFFEFLGLSLLRKWDEPRQAFMGFEDGPVIGLIENPTYNGLVHTMAHVAFETPPSTFETWVERVKARGTPIVAGPKEQRGGRTILFRSPSNNIIEICHPHARTSIEQDHG